MTSLPRCIVTELGTEKRCPRCNEYWPADTDFFYSQKGKKDGLHDWCKACYTAWREARYRAHMKRRAAHEPQAMLA